MIRGSRIVGAALLRLPHAPIERAPTLRDLIVAQEREFVSLQDQLDRVENVGRSITPLMILMIDAIEKFVELDVPFLIEERTKRVTELRKMMSRADVTSSTASGTTPSTPNRDTPETGQVNSSQALSYVEYKLRTR